jgi:putative phage-type endonuclease
MLTERQLKMRQSGIGASEVAAVLGLSPWQSPLDVYQKKLGLTGQTPANPAMEWGHLLEPVIGKKYAEVAGVKLRRGRTVRGTERWMLATPDFLRPDGAPVQVKTARNDDGWGPDMSTEVPLGYACQVAWEMAVVGAPEAVLAVLIGGSDFRCYRLQRDFETEQLIVARCREFWLHNVKAHLPPPARDPMEAKAYLQNLWKRTQGNFMPPSAHAVKLMEELRHARMLVRISEERLLRSENEIKQLIGDADGVECSFARISWKFNRESEKVDWKAVAMKLGATPELIKQHSEVRPGARVFRVSGTFFEKEEESKDGQSGKHSAGDSKQLS